MRCGVRIIVVMILTLINATQNYRANCHKIFKLSVRPSRTATEQNQGEHCYDQIAINERMNE